MKFLIREHCRIIILCVKTFEDHDERRGNKLL